MTSAFGATRFGRQWRSSAHRRSFGTLQKVAPTPISFGSGTSIKAGRGAHQPGQPRRAHCRARRTRTRHLSDALLGVYDSVRALVGDRFDPKRDGSAVYAGVTAHRDRGGWVLEGTTHFVLDGDRADRLAVVTAAGVFIVDASEVTARRADVFDPVLHVADLRFANVHIPEENRVATDPERAWQIALTGMAITTVGASQRIVDLTLEHLKQRSQFGVPIGSFQALQHKAADMHVAVERARALSYFAALTIAADDPRRRLSAMMAKAAAGEAQSLVVQHGMQSFGAMGFTWENDLQFAVKRARAGELMLGAAAEHRALIAKEYRAADF